MTVVAAGMGTYELLVACLGDGAVASDVVVVAGEPEAIRVTADEGCHGKALVAAGGAAVNNNQMNFSHRRYIQLVTPRAVAMAERILMVV